MRGIYVLAGGSKCSVVIADWLVCIADVSGLGFDGDVFLAVEFSRHINTTHFTIYTCLMMGETPLETSPKNMIQDMINSDNINSTESTILNIFNILLMTSK